MAKPTNNPLHALPEVWTLVHIVSAVGVGVWVFGNGWGWACLVGIATQVPWSMLLQVPPSMSVVLHYSPLNIYQLCKTWPASPAIFAWYHQPPATYLKSYLSSLIILTLIATTINYDSDKLKLVIKKVDRSLGQDNSKSLRTGRNLRCHWRQSTTSYTLATSFYSSLHCLWPLKKPIYFELLASGDSLHRGVCGVLRPGHAGWYHWWCCTWAPGVCACWACLVLTGAERTFAGSCCGCGVHWGPCWWSFWYR